MATYSLEITLAVSDTYELLENETLIVEVADVESIEQAAR